LFHISCQHPHQIAIVNILKNVYLTINFVQLPNEKQILPVPVLHIRLAEKWSLADIEISQKLKEAGEMMNIRMLDHIIVGEGRFCSMKELGWI
jgi:hypothetical protein